jgi:N-acetylneuraminate synthase/sialic acid synthase
MREFAIGNTLTGDRHQCFVVAEIGHNHQGDLDLAKVMMKAAKDSGASAAKLQKRHLTTLFTEQFAAEPYDGKHSYGRTYMEHRQALELGTDSWRELADYANALELIFFGTAFDPASADFLAELGVPVIKIASADALNWPLLDHVATLDMPMIVSTGGLTWAQLDATVQRLRARSAPFSLLHCTSAYPCPPDEIELLAIPAMRERYPDVAIGYSGHEEGIVPSLGAIALGAAIVERHFTVDQSLKGSDQRYSLLPPDMSRLVNAGHDLGAARGTGVKRMFESEKPALRKLGKKLVAAHPLTAGHVVSAADLEIRSPGDGLSPHLQEALLGRELAVDIERGADLRWACLR